MRRNRHDDGLILAGVVAAVAVLLLWGSPLLRGMFPVPVVPGDSGAKPVVVGDHQNDLEAQARRADLAVPMQIRGKVSGR